MQIKSMAIGSGLESDANIILMRDALLGMALLWARMYEQQSGHEFYAMVYPFLRQPERVQRVYFFMSLLTSQEDGFSNRLYTNIISQKDAGENDRWQFLPLAQLTFLKNQQNISE